MQPQSSSVVLKIQMVLVLALQMGQSEDFSEWLQELNMQNKKGRKQES